VSQRSRRAGARRRRSGLESADFQPAGEGVGRRVALASGTSAEWMAFGSNAGRLIDYSPPARRAWRTWLRARYANDVDALRDAWQIGGVAFHLEIA